MKCCHRNGDGKDVAFNEGRAEKRPRIDEGQLGHKGEVRDDDVGVFGPLSVSDGGAENRLEYEADEQSSCYRRDVESVCHGSMC